MSRLVPGERHRGVQGDRDAARRSRGSEHPVAELRGGVHDELPGLPGPGRREPGYERLEFGGRNREQHQLGALDDFGNGQHRNARQQGVGSLAAVLRHRRDADDRVTGSSEGGTENRPDVSSTDDADAETARAFSHASSPLVE